MTIRRLSADLTSREFPFNFQELSSTIVLNQGSEISRSTPNRFSGAQSEQQMGIPQAYYMENVVPISRGFASLHYKQVIPPIPGVVGIVERYYELRGDAAGLALLAVTATNQYVYDAYTVQWYDITITNNSYSNIYVGNVKEECYIFVSGDKLYRYDFGSRVLVPVTPTALDVGAMKGMFASGIVLGFWDIYNRVYYSSVFDPLDFLPSLSTGAGSQNIVAVVAKILTIESMGEDIIIYTKKNAVAGRATGDVQFPFVFREVVGSEGAYDRNNIAYDSNAGIHLVWTGNAFQELTVTNATYIWPELRDGITRGLTVSLDPALEIPVLGYTDKVEVKMQFCSNNYVAISLKKSTDTVYKEAYVYDQTLQRWGRLVVDHMFIFDNPIVPLINGYTYAELEAEYPTYAAIDGAGLSYFDIESGITQAENPPGINFAVLGSDGRVHLAATSETADFRGDNIGIAAALPRIFMGRYKWTRDLGMMLEGLILKNLINGRMVAHGHLYSGDFVRKDEEFFEVLEQPGYYNLRCNADSVSIELNGTFLLSTLLIEGAAAQGQHNFGVPPNKKVFTYAKTEPYSPSPVAPKLILNMIGRNNSQGIVYGGEAPSIPAACPVIQFIDKIPQPIKIYQRYRVFDEVAEAEIEGFNICAIDGNYAISAEIDRWGATSRVVITPYLLDEQIVTYGAWESSYTIPSSQAGIITLDDPEYYPTDIVMIKSGVFLILSKVQYENLTRTLHIVTYSTPTNRTVLEVVLPQVAELVNITGGETYTYETAAPSIAVNMETFKIAATLRIDGADGGELPAYDITIPFDYVTGVIDVSEIRLASTSSYSPILPTVTGTTENVFEHRLSDYYYAYCQISFDQVYLHDWTEYGSYVPWRTYNYRNVTSNPAETEYVDVVDEITILASDVLNAKLMSLGYPDHPYIKFGAISAFAS